MASNADLFIEGQVSGISVMLNVILRKLIETDQIAAMQLEPVLQEVESIRARIEKKVLSQKPWKDLTRQSTLSPKALILSIPFFPFSPFPMVFL